MRKIKEAEVIKIRIKKEAEKLQNHTCVSSSERSAYLAEESRRTVGLWSTTTASLACSLTSPSSPSTSVPAEASRTLFPGSRGRSLSPEFVQVNNGTLCAGSQCPTADNILSKDDNRSQPRLVCWPMREGGLRQRTADPSTKTMENHGI